MTHRLVIARLPGVRLIALCALASSVACASAGGPRQIQKTRPDASSAVADWSRVSGLTAPADIVLTTDSAPAQRRMFVAVEGERLTVLNLDQAVLPPRAARALRAMVADSPTRVAALGSTEMTLVRDGVQVGRGGVLIDGRTVADLDRVLERVTRGDVREIRGPVLARGNVAGATIGVTIGLVLGVEVGGALACCAESAGGASGVAALAAFLGSVVGGGMIGDRSGSHTVEGVVYRRVSP